VTVRLDQDFVAIRADKNFGGRIDDSVNVRIATDLSVRFRHRTTHPRLEQHPFRRNRFRRSLNGKLL